MSEAVLCAEYVPGVTFSEAAIPLNRWSHVAAVFGETETRLYLDGKKVGVCPATKPVGGAVFVVGNVGRSNPINYFIGSMRSVRISKESGTWPTSCLTSRSTEMPRMPQSVPC